ncbi:MAG: hypothetical protein AAF320_01910 [Myxococcota bacterium]
MLITEIYANAPGRVSDTGKEWLEVYNASDHPVALAGLTVRRIDGSQTPQEAWRILLQQSNVEVPVGGYAIIAQSPDLGLGLCPQIPVHVVADEAFSFKNSGVQQVCVQEPGRPEHCVKLSDSKTFPDGQSRHLPSLDPALGGEIEHWAVEDCPLPDGALGSPGLALGACHQGEFLQMDPWYADWICPDSEEAVAGSLPANNEELVAAWQQEPNQQILALAQQPLPQLDLHVQSQTSHHVAISYQALTPVFGPLVHMSVYASTHPNALDGILIASAVPLPTRPEQNMQVISSVRSLPKGTYTFFARLQGVQGHESIAYAPESIAIDNTTALPNLRIMQAHMEHLSSGRQVVHLSWDVDPGMLGTLTLYARDTADAKSTWQPVVTGLQSQDLGGKYVWYPQSISAKSSFEVYGLLRIPQGSVTSAVVQVQPPEHLPSCQGAAGGAANAGHDAAFVLLWVVYRAALHKTARRKHFYD